MHTGSYLVDVLKKSLEYYLKEESIRTEFVTDEHKNVCKSKLVVAENYLNILKEGGKHD